MLALALCESSIGAHLQPYRPSSPSTARSSPPSLASFPSLQRAQKHSLGNSPRHVMWWPRYRYLNETLSTNCQRASSSDIDIGLRCLDNCIGQMALEPVKLSDSPPLMDKSPEDIGFTRGNYSSVSVNQNKVLLSNICKGLKFTILTGLLSSQGSQQAIADTEFARVQLMRYLGDLGDISTANLRTFVDNTPTQLVNFLNAFLLIFFSELGDKTFFIAALLAARNSGAVVFIGTFGALAAMSVVSVILGRTFHYVDGILPFRFGEADFPIDDFAAVCLLIYFGVTTLLEAASDTELNIKEEQKEAELAISEVSGNGAGIMAAASTVISTFILVFVAEWGDKSFFSTIALAAASSPLGVICGALAGHALATLVAVVGGSLLGTFLSEKVIAYIGGVLFLVFAAVTLIEIVS